MINITSSTLDEIVIEQERTYTRETAPIQPSCWDKENMTGGEIARNLRTELGYLTQVQCAAMTRRSTDSIGTNAQLLRRVKVVISDAKHYFLISPEDQERLIGRRSLLEYVDYQGIIDDISPRKTYTPESLARECKVSRSLMLRLLREGNLIPSEKCEKRTVRHVRGADIIKFIRRRRHMYSVRHLALKSGLDANLLYGLVRDGFIATTTLGGKSIPYAYVQNIELFRSTVRKYLLTQHDRKNKFKGDMFFEYMIEARETLTATEFSVENLGRLYRGIRNVCYRRFGSFEAALTATADYTREEYPYDPQKLKLADRFSMQVLLDERSAEKGKPKLSQQPPAAPVLPPIDLKAYLSQVVQVIARRVNRSEKAVAGVLTDAISDLCALNTRSSRQESPIVERQNVLYYDPSHEAELEQLVIKAAGQEFNVTLEKTDSGYVIAAKTRKKGRFEEIGFESRLQKKPEEVEYVLLEDYVMPIARVMAKDILAKTRVGYKSDSEEKQKTREILERLVNGTVALARGKHQDIDLPKDLITDKEGKPAYNKGHVAYLITLLKSIVNKQGYTLTVLDDWNLTVERK